jgi:hypothetical protein
MLLDRQIFKEILLITCAIFKNNFFYDKESIERFLKIFTEIIKGECEIFDRFADENIRLRLKYDHDARKEFTAYFVSIHLREIMIEHLNFSEMELQAFENVLPKYSEASDDVEPYSQRAHR